MPRTLRCGQEATRHKRAPSLPALAVLAASYGDVEQLTKMAA